jgi:hypothetical protein
MRSLTAWELLVAVRFISAGCCAVALASSPVTAAADAPVGTVLASAFAETCLGGQPSLQAVRWAAVASGWVAQPVRVVSTLTGARVDAAAAPLFLKKDGFTLTLMEGESVGADICGVSTATDEPLSTTTLAQALSAARDVGEPVIVSDDKGERAFWRLGGGIQVEASVRRKGSLRNASLVAGPTAREIALRD